MKQRQGELSFAIARDAGGNALNRVHRRKFLLSGLLVCGVCWGGYTMMAKDRYGCAAHRNQGTCTSQRTIGRLEIEGRVLDGLKYRLLAPDLFEAFAQAFQSECNRLGAEAAGAKAGLEGRFAETGRRIAAIVRAVEDDLYQPSMKERLAALEAEKARLVAELATLPAQRAVHLHSNLPALYWRKVEDLQKMLGDGEVGTEATDTIRSLIVRIVLKPREEGGLAADLEGDLAQILAISEQAQTQQARRSGLGGPVQVWVVAKAGSEPPTFRL